MLENRGSSSRYTTPRQKTLVLRLVTSLTICAFLRIAFCSSRSPDNDEEDRDAPYIKPAKKTKTTTEAKRTEFSEKKDIAAASEMRPEALRLHRRRLLQRWQRGAKANS